MRACTVSLICLLALLAGCAQPAASDARAGNPSKYDADRQYCRAQTDEYMSRRRTIDDSRNAGFDNDRDRFGQGALPEQMNDYSDNRNAERFTANCMEARGWPQPATPWWQKPITFKI